MRKLLLALSLLFAPALLAQTTQTLVSGTILDPNGVPYYPATVTACLTPVTINPIVNGQPVNPNPGANYCLAQVQTTPSGFFQRHAWPNGGITPGGTQWTFSVAATGSGPPAGKGPQTFQVNITVSGATQDVGATLTAAAPILLNSGGGANGVPISPTTVNVANNPGVFNTTTTVTTMSTPNVFTTGVPPSGTSAQCPQNIFNNFAGTGFTDTDALDGCIFIPAGNGVTNLGSTGVQGWAYNNNSATVGQAGFSVAVGTGGFSWCNAGGANFPLCAGGSFNATSTAANGGSNLEGVEADVTANNTADKGVGVLASMHGTAQPTANNFKGFWAQGNANSKFTSAFFCDDGAVSQTATDSFGCMIVGDSNNGSHDSQGIYFHGGGTAGNTNRAQLYNAGDNYMALSGRALIVGHNAATGAGNDAGFGINGKATATLAAGVLVKIDTANADSFVICTTADTSCDGVTAGGAEYCTGAGVVGCGIITVPGSKVELTLGTGTCAIGNFVIVDTTTNGRIKCTAVQPGVGTYIGKALSAQASVGGIVDVLTKFQ